MFGLDYILASHLMLASTTPTVKCIMKTAPQITVSAVGLDRGIDHTKSVRDLNAFKPQTSPSPYGMGADTYIQGLAKGGVSVQGQYQFSGHEYPSLSQGCLFVDKVNITITLDSTIFIAREYKEGTCFYKAVLEHERKHRAVDRALVNKYSNIIVKAVNNTMKTIGYAQGPFDSSQKEAIQARIANVVGSILSQYGDNFSVERERMQTNVDTLTEYDRVHALCKDWPQPKL